MLDNHPQHRTYLIIQAACVDKVHLSTQSGELDFLQLIAAKWQCLRAEIEASKEFKNRDLREAQYLSEIRQREQFIDNMKLVHQVALELSNPPILMSYTAHRSRLCDIVSGLIDPRSCCLI